MNCTQSFTGTTVLKDLRASWQPVSGEAGIWSRAVQPLRLHHKTVGSLSQCTPSVEAHHRTFLPKQIRIAFDSLTFCSAWLLQPEIFPRGQHGGIYVFTHGNTCWACDVATACGYWALVGVLGFRYRPWCQIALGSYPDFVVCPQCSLGDLLNLLETTWLIHKVAMKIKRLTSRGCMSMKYKQLLGSPLHNVCILVY